MTVREVPFNRPDRIVFELFFLLTTFSAGSRRGDKAAGGIVGINSPRGRVVASDPLPFHSGDRKTRERCCVARKRDPWCYRGPEQPANRDLCAIDPDAPESWARSDEPDALSVQPGCALDAPPMRSSGLHCRNSCRRAGETRWIFTRTRWRLIFL